ncbi:UGSC family (seleno)protein [Dankookia sp. P2]|uniref:UGSC family (seleno)protein n=1 Tax=Dankookia sp. P2 TaxID=3423955 RepID=UPI003D67F309
MLTTLDADSRFVFDPRGRVDSAETPIAPRPAALGGLRLGILDNSKWNANKLLRGAQAALEGSLRFAAVTYAVKHSFSKDADPALIAKLAAECDIVLTAIGDCGSCCSCCVRDSIALERLGVPAACIITTRIRRGDQADPGGARHAGAAPGGDRPPRQLHHGRGSRRARGADRVAGAGGVAGALTTR